MKEHQIKIDETYSYWYYIIPPALLTLITALIYYPSLHYPFQFDDVANITKHFNLRHYTFAKLFFINTRWISHWLNSVYYNISAADPFIYRVGNVVIHCLNGLLVFTVLFLGLSRLSYKSFFKSNAFGIAILTALLFFLHPVQTQTVSYVCQGQLEGIATLFTLVMTLCLLALNNFKTWYLKIPFYVLLFLSATLVCGTKEIAIISPILLITFDWFFLSQGFWSAFKKRLLVHGALFTIIWSLYLYLLKPGFFKQIFGLQIEAHNNLGNMITKEYSDIITPFHYMISQFKVVLHYLWMFLWPVNISVEYDWKLVDGFFSFDCFIPFCILLALAVGIGYLLWQNHKSLIGFGALWFVICIAPRSSIVPSCELIVDYKTYLASVGWLFLIATGIIWGIHYLLEKNKQFNDNYFSPYKGHYIAFGLCIILLSAFTFNRNTIWRSGLEFWGNMIKNAPGKARAYNNYGVELSQALGQYEEAIPYFKRAIMMDKLYRDPYNNLAVAYAALRQFDLAIAILRESLKNYPYYPEAYNNIGSFLLEKDKLDAAEQAFEMAIRLRGHYGKAHFNMGRLHFARGKHEEAWKEFKIACTQADLDNETGFSHFGKLSLMLSKYDDAIFGYERAIKFNPKNVEYLFNLANAHFFKENFLRAEQLYLATLQLDPKDVRALFNLGETYLLSDRAEQALFCFDRIQVPTNTLPQLIFKRAECYRKLNNLPKAKEMLTASLDNSQLPAEVKNKIQEKLKELS